MPSANEKLLCEISLGRSTAGTLCGGSAVVLAVLALVHLLPSLLLAIATIVLGASLLFKGAVISAEYSKLLAHTSGDALDKVELCGGTSIEVLTGIAGIVLGILALLSIDPNTLVAVANITFGGGVIMGTATISRLVALRTDLAGSTSRKVAHEIMSSTMGIQILAGLAVIALGILSLIGFFPMTLNLVAILVLGSAFLLSGSAIIGRMLSMFDVS